MPTIIDRPSSNSAIAETARLIYIVLREHSSAVEHGMDVDDLQRAVSAQATGKAVTSATFSKALLALMDASLIKWDNSFRITIPK